jgi:hypothetical protein
MENNMPGTKATTELGQGGVPGGYSKFYVGFGNNYQLVKQILKTRWWYTPSEHASYEETNLVWTSWRKHKITARLPTYEDFIV